MCPLYGRTASPYATSVLYVLKTTIIEAISVRNSETGMDQLPEQGQKQSKSDAKHHFPTRKPTPCQATGDINAALFQKSIYCYLPVKNIYTTLNDG
jgi:hypothetical protein